jgi:predicted transcriptional regulator
LKTKRSKNIIIHKAVKQSQEREGWILHSCWGWRWWLEMMIGVWWK